MGIGAHADMTKTALVTLSTAGAGVILRLAKVLVGADLFVHSSARWQGEGNRFGRLLPLAAKLFPSYHRLVFVAPCGAVVRAIAPLLGHKTTDPAVAVVDVGARHVISLLSGHEGGANDLAMEVSNVLGAEPVVTTTMEAIKDLIVGVGCRRDAPAANVVAAVRGALQEANLVLDRVRLLASADLKAREPGLLAAARELGLPLRFIAAEEIRSVRRTFRRSKLVEEKVGLPAVAEPAALLAGRRTQLLLPRRVFASVTVAVAQEGLPWSGSAQVAPSIAPTARNKPLPKARSLSDTRGTCT
jgi:cobalt-precorrin 5A hydrolase